MKRISVLLLYFTEYPFFLYSCVNRRANGNYSNSILSQVAKLFIAVMVIRNIRADIRVRIIYLSLSGLLYIHIITVFQRITASYKEKWWFAFFFFFFSEKFFSPFFFFVTHNTFKTIFLKVFNAIITLVLTMIDDPSH